jgi:hypothetical protein
MTSEFAKLPYMHGFANAPIFQSVESSDLGVTFS